MLPPEILVNKEISLKFIKHSDATQCFKLIEASRAYLREWLSWVDLTKSQADTEKFIDFTVKQHSENKIFCYAIWFNNNFAGIISIQDLNISNKKGYIGYWVGEKFRGKKICKNSTKALINSAFKSNKFHSLRILCATKNIASQSIPKALGFKFEGTHRDNEFLYDKYVDHHVYSILENEWSSVTKTSFPPQN